MTGFIHVGTFATATARNLTDLALARFGDGVMLYGVSHVGGGLSMWSLDDVGRTPGLVRTYAYPDWMRHLAEPGIAMLDRPGGTTLLMPGIYRGADSGRALDDTGWQRGADLAMTRAPLPPDMLTAEGVTTSNGQSLLVVARHERSDFSVWRQARDGSLAQISSSEAPPRMPYAAQIDSLTTVRIGAVDLIVSASTLGNYVAVHRIGPDGRLAAGEYLGSARGTGFNGPRHVEHVEVEGHHFLIVASAGSSSLSVVRILAGGQLIPVDHVLDELTTRFQGATEMTSVRVGTRSFVIAGGADDGLSLFTVTPDGRLIHLDTIVDAANLALANISALAATVVRGRIVVMASSATEPGVSQFVIDPGTIGLTRHVGYGLRLGTGAADMIQGGADTTVIKGFGGDDVLIAGSGSTALYGGPGADRFVPLAVSGRVAIKDFQPGTDEIDLSMLGMVRSIAQIRIVSMNGGLRLRFGETVIDVYPENGSTLTRAMIANDLFTLAHYQPPNVRSTIMGTARSEVLTASRGGSTIWANGGNDTVLGSRIEDRLIGGAGHDHVSGASGDDTLLGRDGNDRLFGGAGRDSLVGGSGNDFLSGDHGIDRLLGAEGNDRLLGGYGDDRLFGGLGNDWLDGGVGNDTLIGDAGNDTLNGGLGNDTLTDALGLNVMTDLSGNNLLIGNARRDVMTTGVGNDTLRAGGGADLMSGGGGADLLDGGAGHDLLRGGSGADNLLGGSGDDTLLGEADNDRLFGAGGVDLLNGGTGADYLSSGLGNDSLLGGDGADSLYGGDGSDTLLGGLGHDLHSGGEAADLLRGSAGNDVLSGDGGNDQIFGDSGADNCLGGAGDDTLYGGLDGDQLDGGAGLDLVLGGAGNDLVRGGDGDDMVMGETGDDTLDGGAGDDVLLGGDQNDRLEGGDGRDLLTAGSGDDLCDGGAGDDVVAGDAGNDTLRGDLGNDTLDAQDGDDSLEGGEGDDYLSAGRGNDKGRGGAGADVLSGQDGNDHLWGDAGDDLLSGDADNDSLIGGAGRDWLSGGDGNDRLDGEADADTLRGGAGADTLSGGEGDDHLSGGDGADVFVFSRPEATPTQRWAERDVVLDFHHADDLIDLSGAAAIWRNTATFSGLAGELRWSATSEGATLEIDSDGDRAADVFILLSGQASVARDDLIL